MYRCAFCKKPIIADLEEIVVIADEIYVHKPHAKPMLRKIQREGIVKILKEVAVACVIILLGGVTFAQPVSVDKGVKACTYEVRGFHGDFVVDFEKVLVFGEKPNLDEDGNPAPEYWILNLTNPNRNGKDSEGHLKTYNVPKDSVLFMDKKYGQVFVQHRMKTIKCPSFFWGAGDSGVSADH